MNNDRFYIYYRTLSGAWQWEGILYADYQQAKIAADNILKIEQVDRLQIFELHAEAVRGNIWELHT